VFGATVMVGRIAKKRRAMLEPANSEIERRDRALIAFTALTGARDGAIASLKLKHIDIEQGRVDQDARQVKTKFSKSFTTWFFPVGDDIRQIVVDWVNYLRKDKLWGLRLSNACAPGFCFRYLGDEVESGPAEPSDS
jgi:hypothetical protein